MAAVTPAFPPAPVIYPQKERRHIERIEMVSSGTGMPALKMYRMPEYPRRRRTKADASETRGPLISTMRPHTGPVVYTPTGSYSQARSGCPPAVIRTVSRCSYDVELSVRELETCTELGCVS